MFMSKKICCVSGCDKEVHGLGYCNSHYKNFKRYGTPIKPVKDKPTVCTVDGCNEPVKCKGMCSKHYYHSNKDKEPKEKIEYDECIVDGCTNKPYSKYKCYCGKHNQQMKEHGRILERTIYDSNEIIKDEINNCAYVVLYNKEGEEIAQTKIDLYMVDEISKYKWRFDRNGDKHKRIDNDKIGFLHRYIWTLVNGDIPNGMMIDHKDRDPLNNTIDNLRLATPSQNSQNRSIRSDNKTGVLNVFINGDKYIVKVNGIKYGRYDTLEEAKEVARRVSIELYGEFSPYYDDNDKDNAAPNS